MKSLTQNIGHQRLKTESEIVWHKNDVLYMIHAVTISRNEGKETTKWPCNGSYQDEEVDAKRGVPRFVDHDVWLIGIGYTI